MRLVALVLLLSGCGAGANLAVCATVCGAKCLCQEVLPVELCARPDVQARFAARKTAMLETAAAEYKGEQ